MLNLRAICELLVYKIKRRLKGANKGEGLVEYGLIIGLIAIIVVAIFLALGPQIKELFTGPVSSGQLEQMEKTMK